MIGAEYLLHLLIGKWNDMVWDLAISGWIGFMVSTSVV
jgi:hypothetical protein